MKTDIAYIYGLIDPRDGRIRYIGKNESAEKGWIIAKLLIENDPGANPSVNDNAVLISAVAADKYEEVKYLLYHGADPNLGSPINKAINIEMIRLLVENGGIVSTENFMVVIKSYKDLKYLLDHGANPGLEKSKILEKAITNIENEERGEKIFNIDFFGSLAFYIDNTDLSESQIKSAIGFVENYSGFNLKEYLLN
jgi:ankyrin repeat protein